LIFGTGLSLAKLIVTDEMRIMAAALSFMCASILSRFDFAVLF
jgi:hypothetical protein